MIATLVSRATGSSRWLYILSAVPGTTYLVSDIYQYQSVLTCHDIAAVTGEGGEEEEGSGGSGGSVEGPL